MKNREKLSPTRLSQKAVIYLRQSSERQVLFNKESQKLQYSMAEQARKLGFINVEIIDEDLGSSAGLASKKRQGFERLLANIALREIGIVFCREVSRLSRTDKDWCRL